MSLLLAFLVYMTFALIASMELVKSIPIADGITHILLLAILIKLYFISDKKN